MEVGARAATRERLLRAGAELLHAQGYAATGVARICEVAEARKGSFYHFWPSKSALMISVLDDAWAHHRRDVLDAAFVDRPLADGLERWGQLLGDVYASQQDGPAGRVLGCRFGRLAQEAPDDPALRAHVAARLDAMADLVAHHVRVGVDRDELTSADPDADGRVLVAHMQGLALLAAARDEPGLLRRLGADCRRLVGLVHR